MHQDGDFKTNSQANNVALDILTFSLYEFPSNCTDLRSTAPKILKLQTINLCEIYESKKISKPMPNFGTDNFPYDN